MKRKLLTLVLAAGKGTRFKSDKIKVLHPMLGKPMIQLVVDCMFALRPEAVYREVTSVGVAAGIVATGGVEVVRLRACQGSNLGPAD